MFAEMDLRALKTYQILIKEVGLRHCVYLRKATNLVPLKKPNSFKYLVNTDLVVQKKNYFSIIKEKNILKIESITSYLQLSFIS